MSLHWVHLSPPCLPDCGGIYWRACLVGTELLIKDNAPNVFGFTEHLWCAVTKLNVLILFHRRSGRGAEAKLACWQSIGRAGAKPRVLTEVLFTILYSMTPNFATCHLGMLPGHLCGKGVPFLSADQRQPHFISDNKGPDRMPWKLVSLPPHAPPQFHHWIPDEQLSASQYTLHSLSFFSFFSPNVSQHVVYYQMVK